eukprot:1152466-Pelagomonas_calceolata.AAC.2
MMFRNRLEPCCLISAVLLPPSEHRGGEVIRSVHQCGPLSLMWGVFHCLRSSYFFRRQPKGQYTSSENNPSRRLPHLAQNWPEKSRIGKSGHTQMAAAIST